MAVGKFETTALRKSYDVVIIGGAMYGSAVAWYLTDNPDFDGTVLVIERDPTYTNCATAHTNSCIRQQFSNPLNVKISQFGATFIKGFKGFMGDDPRVPDLSIKSFGYMYLADTDTFANQLRTAQKVQLDAGAATQLMTPDQIKATYPFYNVDDIVLGSINLVDEGYWDGGTVFDWWRRSARERGVEYIAGEVSSMHVTETHVHSVILANGDVISCGKVVNATGPHGAKTAKMAGIKIPIEPRKRFTWIFSAEQPLDQA
ncbi:MAG: glycine/D-amino acid oxidase-like deaminating enzyme, partial [Octadecabacter sp.]